mmetsp:Transcript_20982/g.38070  ORF Transcript_20982/g.38070 Transcript_20982/m.38070 type:complete len:388 (+) Transcript_20982:43-1206(+)
MGCGGSKAADPKTTGVRRRLSVGHVEGGGAEENNESAEEDRGMITSLNEQNLVEILNSSGQEGDRKFSIGSNTDQGKVSFANKSIVNIGEEVDPVAHGLGFTCRKGLKPESPNQDSWAVVRLDGNFSIYGVYDGHGQKGHDVSNFVKENLPKLIIKDQRFKTDDQPKMLLDAFKKVQGLVGTADRMKKLSAQLAGTTATVAIQDHQKNKLTIAHVADSTAVMARWADSTKKQIKGIQLTRDHKPDLKDEKARIEKNGGRVVFDGYANHRVYAKNARYPGLNMSRCLGDLLGHQDCGISCEPEVKEMDVDPLDHILLLCSDGVWEFVTPQEAAELVAEFPAAKAMSAAEKLAKEAWDRWIREEGGAVVDDITVVLAYLNMKGDSNKPA